MKSVLFFSAFSYLVFIGGTFSDKPNPIEQGGLYSISVKNQTLLVDPQNGGRIASLKFGENDFLSGKSVNVVNWGSTFWPSPQSAWGWPPSEELDKKNYTAKVVDHTLLLTSEKDPKLGYVFKKEFSGNTRDTSFNIRYTILNESGKTQYVSPWEITRVKPGGITFYPSGKSEKKGDLSALTIDKEGITWFDYASVKIPQGVPKLLSDGSEGWMAQVNDGKILLKQFEDVPVTKMAPDEGEIELYANPDGTYIEIENQGAYQALKPGESYRWTVTWKLRKLPETVKPEASNSSLIRFARSLLKN